MLSARDTLRRVPIHDQSDPDAIASQLLRYSDGRGDDWADIIDALTMHPEARRKVVRLLAEIDAAGARWAALVRVCDGLQLVADLDQPPRSDLNEGLVSKRLVPDSAL